MSDQEGFSVSMKLLENYLFQADFGDFGRILTDEGEPLGDGEGPTPAHMLATAVLNCLCASLLFAVRKYKGDPGEITATVHGKSSRVDGRLRIEELHCDIHLANDAAVLPNIEKALSQFEGFCTITQSVRHGITVHTKVYDKDGELLHEAS